VPGDPGQNEEYGAQLKEPEEINERVKPTGDLAEPVLGPDIYIKAEKWRINRVFYFLGFVSAACLGALILRSQPEVDAAVVTIWAAAVGLSRYLLRSAYRGGGET
jgi:hypothetical protein